MKPLFATQQKIKAVGHRWNGFLFKNKIYAVLSSDFSKFLGSRDEKFISEMLRDISQHGEVAAELIESVKNPMQLTTPSVLTKSVYTLDILPAICAEIISAKANGFLLSAQIPVAKQAQKFFDEFNVEMFELEIDKNSGFLDLKLKVKRRLVDFMISQESRNEILWVEILNDGFLEKCLKVNKLDWQTAIGNEEKLANFIYDALFIRIPNALFESLKNHKPKRAYIPKYGAVKLQNIELQEFANKIGQLISKSNFDSFEIDKQLHTDFPKFYNREELAFQKQNASNDFPETHFDKSLSKAFAGRPSAFMKG